MELDLFDKLGEKFFIRFLIDILTVAVLIGVVYFRNYRKKDHIFTFMMFNVVIFLITYMLNKVGMSFGAAFGLFAVFSILRYRTENISEKDMTYLFIVIAMGLINSVAKATYFEMMILNGMIILIAWILDANLLWKADKFQLVYYEKIDLVKTQNYDLLLKDLSERTGLNVYKVTVEEIDFLKDCASLKVYYY
jgi:cytochrome c biogenesis factor